MATDVGTKDRCLAWRCRGLGSPLLGVRRGVLEG